MESSSIAELLSTYIVGVPLPPAIFDQLGLYLDLLMRWNARTNLTAIRDPEQIVTRHFGESLFAAGVLFGPNGLGDIPDKQQLTTDGFLTLADLGSGAGFPGLPIKLAFPGLQVTLIESQNKKATFLKEIIRALRLDGIEVYSGRAEQWDKQTDVVTLRAVEKLESVLPVARSLVCQDGRLCLLVGRGQRNALSSLPDVAIEVEQAIPGRPDSLVVVGKKVGMKP